MQRRANVLSKLQKVPIDAVHISVITKSKLLFGVEVSPRRQEDHAAHNAYLRLADYPERMIYSQQMDRHRETSS
jgi:hypothetical protein